MTGLPFREVWAVDFEYGASNGGRPVPVCLVAKELHTGRMIEQWHDDFGHQPPFPTDDGVLFVAYNTVAELSCFLALGWPPPAYVLDLYVEFMAMTNGRHLPAGRGLLGALSLFGIPSITKAEKDAGRNLAMQGHWTAQERRDLLDYCATDVHPLGPLLDKMLPRILGRQRDPMAALKQALLRGRYMAAVARMEHAGIPIDAPLLAELRDRWEDLKLDLIRDIDQQYGVYDGTTFKRDQFAAYLRREGIRWPRLPSGQLALDKDTFKDRALAHPKVNDLRELKVTLSELRLSRLAVGEDGRNRVSLFPFRTKTGRNAPSTSEFVFGPAKWLRGLIKPEPGRAVAYLDWSSQEIAIAANLSGDTRMQAMLAQEDPYIAFAKLAGLVPDDATKQSHSQVRDLCKVGLLGVNYGMGVYTLSRQTGADMITAVSTMEAVARNFPTYWRWAQSNVDLAILSGEISTLYGWPLKVTQSTKPTTLRNFKMQGNGAEMMRLACILATEQGVTVCAPIHDALLVEGDALDMDQTVAKTEAAMLAASRHVLSGQEVAVDAKVIRYPDRYMDKRGADMWERVMRQLDYMRKVA